MEPHKHGYRVVVSAHGQGEQMQFVASVPELPDCAAEASSRSEALARLEEELEARLANMASDGVTPPPPLDTQALSGELQLRISPDLQRELIFWAKQRRMDFKHAVVELLSIGLAAEISSPEAQGGREGPRGRSGPNPRQRYHDIMENRADFIEYVRQMDRGGRGRGRGRRG